MDWLKTKKEHINKHAIYEHVPSLSVEEAAHLLHQDIDTLRIVHKLVNQTSALDKLGICPRKAAFRRPFSDQRPGKAGHSGGEAFDSLNYDITFAKRQNVQDPRPAFAFNRTLTLSSWHREDRDADKVLYSFNETQFEWPYSEQEQKDAIARVEKYQAEDEERLIRLANKQAKENLSLGPALPGSGGHRAAVKPGESAASARGVGLAPPPLNIKRSGFHKKKH